MSPFDIFCFFFGLLAFYYVRSPKLRHLINGGVAWSFRKATYHAKNETKNPETEEAPKINTEKVRLGKQDISYKEINDWLAANPDFENDNPELADLIKGMK